MARHGGTVEPIAGVFEAEKRKEISGVVGGYDERPARRSRSQPEQALFLLAFISLSLGVINLFPFLPLDGGHISGRWPRRCAAARSRFAVMERAGFVGFVLVIMLFMRRVDQRRRPDGSPRSDLGR